MFGLGSITGPPKEKAEQLHFRDDSSFEFRFLEIEDTFLVERDKEDIKRGWKHLFRLQFPFAGYKNMRKGQVTLSFDRDIILDPYGIIENDRDNPEKRQEKKVMDVFGNEVKLKGTRAWLSDVGEARRSKIMGRRKPSQSYNRIILFLGGTLILQILIVGIEVLVRMGK